MTTHLHTKAQNANKIQVLIDAAIQLYNVGIVTRPQDLLSHAIDDLNLLATEANSALQELKEQTEITPNSETQRSREGDLPPFLTVPGTR